ncbi:WD40-repeat-containing domain protein, partial [Baffinella frigidus]
VAFSPDGTRIVSGSQDNHLQIFDAETGPEVHTLSLSAPVARVKFSDDGAQVISESDDHTVRVWDVASGKEVRQLADFHFVEGEDDMPFPDAAEREHNQIVGLDCETDVHALHAVGDTLLIVDLVQHGGTGGSEDGAASVGSDDGLASVVCFKAPQHITAVQCHGATICVGCHGGAVCILQAPLPVV